MQKFTDQDNAFKNAPMANFVKKLQILGTSCFLALILYYPLLFVVLDPDNQSPYIPLVLFWLPLLAAVKGILNVNPYTFAWSNFVLMWCFIHGLTAIWTFTGHKGFIAIELALLTGAFIGNTYFARYRGRELGMALPKIKQLKEQEKARFEQQNKP